MRLLLLMLGISVCVVVLEHAPGPKTIRGAPIIAVVGTVAAVQIAGSQHFNNAWTP
jgi:hypothetical protein